MTLSIIIVNWNTEHLLDECLASIYQETKDIDFEIFVVDNASSDSSARTIREKYPAVRLIENKENRGFAAANNQAIKQASGKYILLLNPDTVVLNSALPKAIKVLEANPNVGILGAKTYNKDMSQQKTIRKNPALATQLIFPRKMKQIFPNWKALKDYYKNDFNYGAESFVEQIQGSFMLVKKEIFQKIGLLDEKFFIWFEEVDFCLRARRAGYKIIYSPEASIIHYGGVSFAQIFTLKKQELYARSMLYYFWKHKPAWQYLILLIFKLPIIILSKIIKQ